MTEDGDWKVRLRLIERDGSPFPVKPRNPIWRLTRAGIRLGHPSKNKSFQSVADFRLGRRRRKGRKIDVSPIYKGEKDFDLGRPVARDRERVYHFMQLEHAPVHCGQGNSSLRRNCRLGLKIFHPFREIWEGRHRVLWLVWTDIIHRGETQSFLLLQLL